LALAVCSRALEAEAGLRSFVEFRQSLSDTQHDELELAAELSSVLPNGHEKSVAATLFRSVRALRPEGLDFLRLASLLAAAPIPPSLVAAIFAATDNLDGAHARRRAALGFTQATNACLATRTQNKTFNVHALISRTVRFHDLDRTRNQQLRAAIVASLNSALPAVADIRSHQRLSLEVLHARDIVSRGIHDNATATLAIRVARHDSERGAYATARLLQEQVVAVRRRILGMEHPDTLTAMNNLALTLGDQGDFSSARSLQEQILATERRVLGEEHPKTQSSITNLAATLRELGNLTSARELQEQALATRLRVLGEEHPDTLTAMHSLALTLRVQGDLASTRTLQEQVLAIRQRIFGEGHPDILSSMNNLAGTLRAQRDLTNARLLQELVLTISRRIFGEQHPHTLTAMNNLAMTLSDQGDLSSARSLQEQVLTTRLLLLGAEHPNTLTVMHNLAMTLTDQGDLRGARLLQEQVLASRDRILGAEHPDTTSAEWNLFITLSESGDRVKATLVKEKLFWLLPRDPTTLSDSQRRIREQFQQILDVSSGSSKIVRD
jgi:tetratricopeptide (TPR) repeat protein